MDDSDDFPGDIGVAYEILLAPDVAYATSIQGLNLDQPSKSRVTFGLLRKGDRWGVIHTHYSAMSEEEG